MAFEQSQSEQRDEYGIGRQTAEEILGRYLRDTLGEPDAQLQALRLEDGRWQARVAGSRRGVGTVFLQQHTGTVVGGHTTAASPLAHEAMEASHRHEVGPEAGSAEQRTDQSIPYNAADVEPEETVAPGPIHYQTLKWRDPTGHRSEPAARERPGGTKAIKRGGKV